MEILAVNGVALGGAIVLFALGLIAVSASAGQAATIKIVIDPERRRAAAFAGLVSMVLGIALGVFAVVANSSNGGAAATPAGSTTTSSSFNPTTTSASADLVVVTIASPQDGEGVSSRYGVHAVGSVSGLDELHTLWLLDYDGTDYTPAQQAQVVGNRWSAVSQPLGDKGEVLPFPQTEVVVVASQNCQAKLAAKARSDDSTMSALPVGCSVVARVTTLVDRP